MIEDPGTYSVDTELAAQDRRRAQWAESKRNRRAATDTVSVQIVLTRAEWLVLCELEKQARDPEDFRKKALLMGAKFRANTGRGKDKIR